MWPPPSSQQTLTQKDKALPGRLRSGGTAAATPDRQQGSARGLAGSGYTLGRHRSERRHPVHRCCSTETNPAVVLWSWSRDGADLHSRQRPEDPADLARRLGLPIYFVEMDNPLTELVKGPDGMPLTRRNSHPRARKRIRRISEETGRAGTSTSTPSPKIHPGPNGSRGHSTRSRKTCVTSTC